MGTTRLGIYNGALRELGERKLGSLTENREPRRLLDDVWSDGGTTGFIDKVLGEKQWRFARRTVTLVAQADAEVAFGFTKTFEQPEDFIRTCALCQDERMQVPLLDYHVEAGRWYADLDPIYVTYISNDSEFGGDLSKWPGDFTLWVETYLASLICTRLTGGKADRNELIKLAKIRLRTAGSADASESPTWFPPEGSWVRSRAGRFPRRDGGSRGRLIG